MSEIISDVGGADDAGVVGNATAVVDAGVLSDVHTARLIDVVETVARTSPTPTPESTEATGTGVPGSDKVTFDADSPTRKPQSATSRGLVSQATALLRQHTDSGWRVVEESIFVRALMLFRPSAPVRGHHGLGDFFLASDVVVAELRRVVDAEPFAVAEKIVCSTTDRDELDAVTFTLVAVYGTPLLDLTTRLRAVTLERLQDLLGALAPGAERVRTHVHIGDVTSKRLVT